MTKTLQPTELLKKGWEVVKANPALTVGGVLVTAFLPDVAAGILSNMLGMDSLFGLAASVFSFIAGMGLIGIFLQLLRGKKARWEDLFTQYPKALNFFLATIAVSAMVILGLLFLIVPGIYLAIRYQFFAVYIIDKNMGVMDALKASWKLTEGKVMELFTLGLFSLGVILLGILALGVGILVAMPVVYLAQLSAYEQLSKK